METRYETGGRAGGGGIIAVGILTRVEMIKQGGDVVGVSPYHFIPSPIFAGELSPDPSNEANRFMADWYGKEAIMCVVEETQ